MVATLRYREGENSQRLTYRPEIDGLRAIAVAAVILFHAGLPGFSGGFIGVDVFFVISGFLITSIVLAELQRGDFSLAKFYERRARRLLPALYVVVLFSIPIAWATMLPDPLENFGQSIVATIFFGNNVLLYLTSGYWDLQSEFKPLMHTWSLGVEEQFYLIFPLLLVLLWKYNKKAVSSVILVLAMSSLTFSILTAEGDPDANFYLLFTRLWELLAGSICAILMKKFEIPPNSIASAIGVLGIFASIALFDSNTPFPGPWALVPIVGTMAVLLFGQNNHPVVRLLKARPLVGLGLISYSAYLWHQPLLAFARVSSREQPDLALKIGIVVATLLLAYLSWRFVEMPFRKKDAVGTQKFIAGSAVSALVLASVGLYFHQSNGVPNRVFENQDSYERSYHEFKLFEPSELLKSEFREESKARVLVTGDSYAADAANLISYQNMDEAVEVMLRYGSPCDFLSLDNSDPAWSADIFVVAFDEGHRSSCSPELIPFLESRGKEVFFLGTKHFGDNLNWITRVDQKNRGSLCQEPSDDFLAIHVADKDAINSRNYISIMDPLLSEGCVTITTPEGELISSDSKHLTIAGVEFLADRVISGSSLENAIRAQLADE